MAAKPVHLATMEPSAAQQECMQIIERAIAAQSPRLTLIVAPRCFGKTYAQCFAAIAYAQQRAGTVQTFACNSVLQQNRIANALQDASQYLLVRRTKPIDEDDDWFIFPNTSLIVVSLAEDVYGNAARNVMYIDEYSFLGPEVIQHLCTLMPNKPVIGISTPTSAESILTSDLDWLIGKDEHAIIKVGMSCQRCKDTNQEDTCVHPSELRWPAL